MFEKNGMKTTMSIVFFATMAIATTPRAAVAQRRIDLQGMVVSLNDGTPVAGAIVTSDSLRARARSDDRGRFVLADLTAGQHRLVTRRVGYLPDTTMVTLPLSSALRIALAPQVIKLAAVEVQASALSPDLRPQSQLEHEDIKEANPRDPGELLRQLPGVDAVRRGPVGLDPSVRGMRETEVGVYIDGTRMFPGGPARMDSPLSHLDATTLRNIEVVKGPYALTWGAGNLTAIRVTTPALPPASTGVHGSLSGGYDGNYNATNTAGSVVASNGRGAVWAQGAWRRGNDYTSGDGTTVPADFRSAEGRAKLGYRLSTSSYLTLSGGYQGQGPIDYPGRLLNAKFFHTWTSNIQLKSTPHSGVLQSFEAQAYYNNIHHGMTNTGKPTALADPDRMPPFPLDVGVDAHVHVAGGRVAADLVPGAWHLTAGGDVYSAYRDAVRTIDRRDTGMQIFTDLMWPGATITDGGVFLQAGRPIGGMFNISATGRLDLVRANTDSVSDFFAANTAGPLSANETNFSGAATLRADLSRSWSVSLAVGSAVRTADATERYSDRVPASKAQTSAEFMGNPGLKPERNTQGDLWLEGRFAGLSLHLNPFIRHVANYITLEPTSLPKRLPLSPPTVYRYVNGTANFWGIDANAGVALAHAWFVRFGGSYLRGTNTAVDEPALGVSPLHGDLGLRFQPSDRGYAEITAHAHAKQDRVATELGELATPGYTTLDVRAGWHPWPILELRAGVRNLTDKQYVNHLNAKNPFTGMQLPEVGRVLYTSATYQF